MKDKEIKTHIYCKHCIKEKLPHSLEAGFNEKYLIIKCKNHKKYLFGMSSDFFEFSGCDKCREES